LFDYNTAGMHGILIVNKLRIDISVNWLCDFCISNIYNYPVYYLNIRKLKDSMTIENQKYDVLIYDATPAGITCALRATREGLKVLLVNYFSHIGGC